MPPSATRSSTRARRVRDQSPSVGHVEQSSPSRPSKRRRKAQPDPSSEPADDESSSLTVDASGGTPTNDADTLISQVSQCLTSIPCHAAKEYPNERQQSTQGIEAYAKIAAQDWTYYIRELVINIGRSSDHTNEPLNHGHPPRKTGDKDNVHIDLGPSKVFSRQTAVIFFDQDAGSWFLKVRGRNGLKVNGEPLRKEDPPHSLESGEVIEVGGLEMMFVLPAGLAPLKIAPEYTQRIGYGPPRRPQISSPAPEARHALPPPPSSDAGHSRPVSSRSQTIQQPIAPAPPDYRRPGTPPSTKRGAATQHKSPAYGSSGTMLMNSENIDLSLDENKHIKPQFSYAQMITQAITSTSDHKLTLNGIYQYIMEKFAYYRSQPPGGWQNSIRHNLSLNKAFNKIARSTDEPGKGMKWELTPETKDDMIANAYKVGRGGHRGSSAPSSPNQPSQLNYINHVPKEMASRGPTSARKRKASPVVSPPPSSALKPAQMTPDRIGSYLGASAYQDGSPLPRSSRKDLNGSNFSVASDGPLPRSPPTLSSGYYPDEPASFVTPAPHRVNPRLAPPSTAQRPSQHMPTSSPAPFWKYADVGSTPLGAAFEMSPIKPTPRVNLPNSSSPPPRPEPDEKGPEREGERDVSPVPPSPSRSTVRGGTQETAGTTATSASVDEEVEEENGFDLTKGYESISAYHTRGLGLSKPNVNKKDGH